MERNQVGPGRAMGHAAPFRCHIARGPERCLEHPLPAEPLRQEMVGHPEILPRVLADGPQGDGRVHPPFAQAPARGVDRKSTRLNSSHMSISYAVFCLKKK